MKNRKKIMIYSALLSLPSLFLIANSEIKADSIDSSADVTLSQGIRLTEVPNFDFGTVIYNGTAKTATISDSRVGDKTLSWFDGTPSTEEAKIYATITDVPQEALKDANLTYSYGEKSTAIPSSGWVKTSRATITFNGEKNLVLETQSTTNNSYKGYKYNGIKDFKAPDIGSKKVSLPAGLQAENMELTINWDIESSP